MDKNAHLYSITKTSYIHTTTHLTETQVNTLFRAGENAYKLCCPLNRFITIHYDDYADKKRPQKFVTELLAHTRKWLQRRGIPVAYLYTLENGNIKGIHAHILIHIPKGYQVAFRAALSGWLPFEAKRPRVISKDIQYPSYGALSPLHSIHGTLRYICKGIDPEASFKNIQPINQGEIMGRRWGLANTLRLQQEKSQALPSNS